MDTEDGQIFIRARPSMHALRTDTDTVLEFGVLCANTRKGARQCTPIAKAGSETWATHGRLTLVTNGPGQPSRVFLLERLGSSSFAALSDLYLPIHKTREAHIDAASPLLPSLALRGSGHTCRAYERATGEYTYRCLTRQLCVLPEQCPAQ